MCVIEVLEERYYQVDRPANLTKILRKEWLKDLSDWPLDLLAKSAQNWRQSDKSYAPRSAGQLTASVAEERQERQNMCHKLLALLEFIDHSNSA